MNQLIEALAATELLRDASNALLEKVLAHASPVQLEPGELLLSPEQHNAHVYLLLEGTLSVHFNAPDSPVIRTLTQGDSAGEMSVIDDTVPSAYVKASGRCLVFPLHRDFLLALIRDTHPVAHNLLRSLTRLLKGNTQIIINEQYKITQPDGAVLPGITVSIGLAAGHDNATAESLIATADAQLYAAKQSGRNCVKYSA